MLDVLSTATQIPDGQPMAYVDRVCWRWYVKLSNGAHLDVKVLKKALHDIDININLFSYQLSISYVLICGVFLSVSQNPDIFLVATALKTSQIPMFLYISAIVRGIFDIHKHISNRALC